MRRLTVHVDGFGTVDTPQLPQYLQDSPAAAGGEGDGASARNEPDHDARAETTVDAPPSQADLDRRWAAVSSHRDRLLRLARSRVPSAQDAEDCVQEAMLRSVEFDGLDEERLGQFLTTVTIRLCADYHRRTGSSERLRKRLATWAQDEPGPEESVCDQAEAAWLAAQLAALPARQREVVVARAEGLSCTAVASRLRLSYTTVESALARARRSMRAALESSLALLPTAWVRLSRLTAGAGAAGAAAVVVEVLGGALPPARVPEVPVARPPAVVRQVTEPEVVSRPEPRDAAYVEPPALSHRAVARPGGASSERPRTSGEPMDGDDEPFAAAGPFDVDDEEHDYSTEERVRHCLEHGVSVYPLQCEYPPEEPPR